MARAIASPTPHGTPRLDGAGVIVTGRNKALLTLIWLILGRTHAHLNDGIIGIRFVVRLRSIEVARAGSEVVTACGAWPNMRPDVAIIASFARGHVQITIATKIRTGCSEATAWAAGRKLLAAGEGIGAVLYKVVTIITGFTLMRDAIAAKFRASSAPCIAGGIHIGWDCVQIRVAVECTSITELSIGGFIVATIGTMG